MIYRPIEVSLENKSINALVNNTASCVIDGDTCDAYRYKIYNNSGTLVYDSAKITLSPILYGGDILEVIIPSATSTLVNGNTYTHTFEVFEGINSAISSLVQFYTNTIPVVTNSFTTPISSQSIELNATYTQAEGISMKEYTYVIKDSSGDIILEYNKIGSQNTNYTFSGFENNTSGTIEFKGETIRDFSFTTGELSYTIAYSQPSINIVPSTILDKDTSFVNFSWGVIYQISANTSGTYSYVDNYLKVGNKALQLDNESTIDYDVDFGEDFTLKFKVDLISNFDGKIVELTSVDDKTYILSYSYLEQKFSWDNDGITASSLIVNSPITNAYIVILPQLAYIKIGLMVYSIKI